MPSPERLPIDDQARLMEFIPQPLGHGERQNGILRAMTLIKWQPLPFREQRRPFLPCHQRARQLDQPGVWQRAVQQRIAGQHRALGKSSQQSPRRISPEFLMHILQQGFHALTGFRQATRDFAGHVADLPRRPIGLNAGHIDHPPGARITKAHRNGDGRFGKEKPRACRRVEIFAERHQVIAQRAESMEQHDPWAIAAALAVCSAC